MDENTTKCGIETGRNREQVKHIVPPIPKEKASNLPGGVANSVMNRNFLWLGVDQNTLNDTKNQSIPICKRNKCI